MTVSNKDRRMAVKAVDCAIGEWCDENHLGPLTRNVLNATIVNALIAHGWGPRPTDDGKDWTALNLAYAALGQMPTSCPYHGTDFHKAGTWMGKPRCDSCKQPERVAKALTAIKAERGIEVD